MLWGTFDDEGNFWEKFAGRLTKPSALVAPVVRSAFCVAWWQPSPGFVEYDGVFVT
jgi:hypothetical protein